SSFFLSASLKKKDVDVLLSPVTADMIEAFYKRKNYFFVASRNLAELNNPQLSLVLRRGVELSPKKPLRIALQNPGRSPEHLFFQSWMAQNKLGDLRPWVMNMSPREAHLALQKGFVEGAVFASHALDQARDTLEGFVQKEVTDIDLGHKEISFLLFSKSFIENRPEDALYFLRAYRRWLGRTGGNARALLDKNFLQERIDSYSRLHQVPQGLRADSFIDARLIRLSARPPE